VRELVRIGPGSTHGVRVPSTTVTRLSADAWNDHGFFLILFASFRVPFLH
jgi:hypothetical protein